MVAATFKSRNLLTQAKACGYQTFSEKIMPEYTRLIREKKHRLAVELYQGYVIAAFTICFKDRFPLFVDETIVNKFTKILLTEATKLNCKVLVYLFMPDHLHLILQGKDEYSSLLNLVKLFKQKTAYWLTKNHPLGKWQKDFYDHILRQEEDLKRHVQYVLDNPVRKGIVENWKQYKFRGSTVYDFNNW